MPFDPVTLFLHQDAQGKYFVSSATVTWGDIQDFRAHGTDPQSDDDDQPVGQPFIIGATQANGIFRTATLTFDPNAKIDDSTDDDNWHPCFTHCDVMSLAMDVTGDPHRETLQITLRPAEELRIALRFFRSVHAAAAIAVSVLIGVFTLRIFKRSKAEEEHAEPVRTGGH